MEKQKSLLKGYEPLIEGAVYGKMMFSAEPQGLARITQVVVLGKYLIPPGEKVADYISEIAGKALQIPEQVRTAMTDNGSIEDRLFSLNNSSLMAICSGEVHEAIVGRLPETARMLSVEYGVLPEILIDTGETAGSRSDPEWYERMFAEQRLVSQGLGHFWKLNFPTNDFKKLGYDGLLLKREHLDQLLLPVIEEVRKRHARPVITMKEVLDLVYDSLGFDNIGQVRDTSEQVTRDIAVQIFEQLDRC